MAKALALAGLLSVAAAGAAQADTHSWTLCSPGGFSSCHSVALTTSPIMSGSTRTGTNITITLTNLQGSGYAQDNTSYAGLFEVLFFDPSAVQPNVLETFNSPSSTTTGNASAGGFTQTNGFSSGSWAVWAGGNLTGCNTANSIAYTCGIGSTVAFSFATAVQIDAGSLKYVWIGVHDANSNDHSCYSTDVGFGLPECNVQSESQTTDTVTPEPSSIALLATGLFGMGAVRFRRRRKDDVA